MLKQLMLRGNHSERGAEQGVRTRRVHFHILFAVLRGDREMHGGTMGLADPVTLHELDLLRPVNGVKILDQTMAVCGDTHRPLAQLTLEDRIVAALGATFRGDFLVRQDCAQAGAPVDRGLGDVGETEIVEHVSLLTGVKLIPCPAFEPGDRLGAGLELVDQLADRSCRPLAAVATNEIRIIPGVVNTGENPLRPPHVIRVDGREAAAVVKAQTHAVQLAAHIRDVLLSGDTRMLAGLDRILLGWQAEGVIAHGVQHVLALHAVVAADHVGGQIAERVTDMQALARRVGEHVHGEVRGAAVSILAVAVRQITLDVRSPERTLLVPSLLPFFLDGLRELGVITVRRLAFMRLRIVGHKQGLLPYNGTRCARLSIIRTNRRRVELG